MKLSGILIALCLALSSSLSAKNWEAKWITSNRCQSQTNSWICFQKSVTLPTLKKGETMASRYPEIKQYILKQTKVLKINAFIRIIKRRKCKK